MQKREYI
jgi:hypothetical protein